MVYSFAEINERTGFANGEPSHSEEQVWEYFTMENISFMFPNDWETFTQEELDEMAVEVVLNRWHFKGGDAF